MGYSLCALLFVSTTAFAATLDLFEELEECEPAMLENVFTDDVEVDPPFDVYTPAPEAKASEENPLTVDLRNPIFTQGVLSTHEGGIITAPGMRIQAKHIQYINRIEEGVRVQKISAEGDLMMEYEDRIFVGSRLEYDFVTRTGTLLDGKTFVDMWFLGGDKIELKEDGTFYIWNAFITTCETQENMWEIKAKSVKITQEQLLFAKNIRFEFLKVPLFWLPSYKSNLKVFSDPPIRYKMVWDKGLGPRFTMRYRVISWEQFNLFFRFDYRLTRGPGAALESEYFGAEGRTTFVTRSYGAYDKEFPDERGSKRYRLQGLYHTESKDGRTVAHLTYDKLSDTRMVGDYRSEDFEINTQRRTHLVVTHQSENTLYNLSFQPRINRFQSIDQELPFITIGLKPFNIGRSPILCANAFTAGYLDYVYATDMRSRFKELHLPTSTHAFRLQTQNQLYSPIEMGPITLTPAIGISGIFYSNNQDHNAVWQGVGTYGLDIKSRLERRFEALFHTVQPYLIFRGLTPPTSGIGNHFYFDINDGYFQLNQLKIGVKNDFVRFEHPPRASLDLYTYAYFGKRAFSHTLPLYYLDLSLFYPSFTIKSGIAWNAQEQVWDYTNILTEWTVSKDFAFAAEFRHRSRFDWRKGNHENFIVDVARPISELVNSPLSDGRNTFLSRFFFRLTPKWSCQLQTRNGWGRKNEPAFYAGKFDFFYMLTCSWRIRLSYERMPNDNRFSSSISLVR